MFNKVIQKLQRYQMKRVAYWQLNNMSDNALRDIGITRGDINQVLRGEWNAR
jgi:uncharacterized protein YjiS (DUF1127 family)